MMHSLSRGVIIYGPPASGKDTVTDELCRLDSRFVLFRRLKLGAGRTTGYRMTDTETVSTLRSSGNIIWENHRYGAIYIVDRSELTHQLTKCIPVLHLGQVEAVNAVVSAIPETRWHTIYLWCPRDIAERRIASRQTRDTEARLAAWNETEPLPHADLVINTNQVPASDSAQQILHLVIASS